MFLLLFFFLIISTFTKEIHHSTPIIYIHEELPANTLLYSTTSSSHNLQWLPSSYPYQSYFFLSSNQSLYTTNQSIDREEFCENKLCNCSQCQINLNFLQTLSMNNILIQTIQVIIEDINDHSPTFKQSILKISIAENVPIDYEIPLESAIDHDYGLFAIQNYELYPLYKNPFRLIKSSKPILRLTEILDRDIRSAYQLKLIAYDGGKPPLSGEQMIEISITDINDNAPIFDQFLYKKSLPENQPIGSLILQIHATDCDEDENARLTYSIDDPSSTFIINSQSGAISLNNSLDYEKIRSYSLTIKVQDHGVPQLTNYATLSLDVTDVNDHTPNVLLTQVNGTRMSNRLFNLAECSLDNTPLLYIYITDEDSGDNGRVSCTLNDTRLSLIYLTTNAYLLQINGISAFDYENEEFVVIHLQCSDAGLVSLSTSTLIHLQIDDCNDNPPLILSPIPTNQTLLIPYETITIPYRITQLIIDDRDRSQTKKFSFSWIVLPDLNLTLTSNGTLILDSMPLKLGIYSINLSVSDLGNLTTNLIIQIHIHSLNETENISMKNTSLILSLTFFILIFLAAIFISICFLLACLIRHRQYSKQKSLSPSIISSNEQQITNSSQKTTIEVLDETTNSSHQSVFNYSEKVQRYLTDLNSRECAIDEESSEYSYHSSLQESLKRFEQLYVLSEYQQRTNLDISTFTSESLYV